MSAICPECGATWQDGRTCTDCFHRMLAWEFTDQEAGSVHHLTVLCYHLQHPSLYSPEGLAYALKLLVEFVEHGQTPQAVRRQNRAAVSNARRGWTFKGSSQAHGAYARAPRWTVTAPDVVADGLTGYPARVRAWARSVAEALRASDNLPGT